MFLRLWFRSKTGESNDLRDLPTVTDIYPQENMNSKPKKSKKGQKQRHPNRECGLPIPGANALGRPECFTAELSKEICDRLMIGESLTSICKDDHIPSLRTVCSWLLMADKDEKYASFFQHYEEARRVQAEILVDQMHDIADDGVNDYVERKLKGGITMITADGEHIQRSRLRVDTRKWTAEKMLPKKYGQTSVQKHEVCGMIKTATIDASKLSPEELIEFINGKIGV